ncbi:hypothetical protein F66182_3251 [Fusarium sp. NRRL 66182]|nr:hypothetical protein F66182_3251 [Fusarium sp. NRRL 66182]
MPPRSAAEGKSPGSVSGSGSAAAKLRRAHRKSRNGCLECKRRHIKCDESRPACSNCVVSDRSCSFPPSTSTASSAAIPTPTSLPSQPESSIASFNDPMRNASSSRLQSPADSASSLGASHRPSPAPPASYLGPRSECIPSVDSHAPPTTLPSFTESFAAADFTQSPSSSTLPEALPAPVYLGKHLVLLHHSHSALSFRPEQVSAIVETALEWSSEAPYAVDQLLAISADHLAIVQPENAASHRRTATELQTRALTYFNKDSQEISNPETRYLPRFIFSSLLSLHMVYDTLAHYRASFHVFIERFYESVHLHRGVRTTTSAVFEVLLDSRLGPTFLDFQNAAQSDNTGSECIQLLAAIQNSDLNPAVVDACNKAAHTLQWVFNAHRNLPRGPNVQAASAFPVVLSPEYMEAVRKHRPEALLVLAYYGVLLHRCRYSWLIGDAGAFLVHLIRHHLGSYWQEAMRWPLEELERDQDQ